MAAALVLLSLQTIFDANGRLALGASLYFYEAGTTTPKTVYRAADLAAPFPVPVTLSPTGRVPPIYVGEGAYKVRIIAKGGVLLDEVDGIQGAMPTPEDGGGGTTPAALRLPVGFLAPAYETAPQAGWVRANGATIGDAGSGATERANVDCHDLYVHLWTINPDLDVPGGRGVDAERDWIARKRLTLPDMRGLGFAGRDSMGNGPANRITTATVASPDTVGATGGAQTVTLSAAQMARHSHGGTVADAGQHTHTGEAVNAGGHSHNFPQAQYASDGGASTGQGPVRASLQTVTDITQPGGAHTHALSIVANGVHTHALTIAEAGAGEAHSNLQPTMLGTWYISLGVA